MATDNITVFKKRRMKGYLAVREDPKGPAFSLLPPLPLAPSCVLSLAPPFLPSAFFPSVASLAPLLLGLLRLVLVLVLIGYQQESLSVWVEERTELVENIWQETEGYNMLVLFLYKININKKSWGYMMEDGRWKMEDGRWKMEDGRWKMEDGTWKSRE